MISESRDGQAGASHGCSTSIKRDYVELSCRQTDSRASARLRNSRTVLARAFATQGRQESGVPNRSLVATHSLESYLHRCIDLNRYWEQPGAWARLEAAIDTDTESGQPGGGSAADR